MNQGEAAFRAAQAAVRHLARMHQSRLRRPAASWHGKRLSLGCERLGERIADRVLVQLRDSGALGRGIALRQGRSRCPVRDATHCGRTGVSR
jgi:hypothetical protein